MALPGTFDLARRAQRFVRYFEYVNETLAREGMLWEADSGRGAAGWIPADAGDAFTRAIDASRASIHTLTSDGGQRYDAFWEHGLAQWDIAAGILMVREAQGVVTDLKGADRMLQSGDITDYLFPPSSSKSLLERYVILSSLFVITYSTCKHTIMIFI